MEDVPVNTTVKTVFQHVSILQVLYICSYSQGYELDVGNLTCIGKLNVVENCVIIFF